MSGLDKERIVGALRDEWASIDELISELDDEQWSWPSPLPGWDVRANVVHMFGTEAALLGKAPAVEVGDDGPEHVKNPIGAINEAWVATFADRPPSELVEQFRSLTAERLAVLEAMPEDEWNAVGFTPAGQAPYGRFMQIRVFDCWMHEQDIRYAIRMPGHEQGAPVDVSLDEMSNAMGYVVGKKAGAPSGSSVTFDLRGATSRRIHVEVGERAQVVDELDGPATTTLVLPVISFAHIAGGRLDRELHMTHCEIEGDDELGRRILENLPYTI